MRLSFALHDLVWSQARQMMLTLLQSIEFTILGSGSACTARKSACLCVPHHFAFVDIGNNTTEMVPRTLTSGVLQLACF
jgi:hypothetical protein